MCLPLAHQIAPSLSVEDRCNFSIRLAHIVEAHKDYVSGTELPWKATLGAVSQLMLPMGWRCAVDG